MFTCHHFICRTAKVSCRTKIYIPKNLQNVRNFGTLISLEKSFTRSIPVRNPLCYTKYFMSPAKRCRDFSSAMSTSSLRNEYKCQRAEDFSNLAVNSETEKKIKLILMEFTLAKQMQANLPDALTEKDMINLLEIPSFAGRNKYFSRYLRKIYLCELAESAKKQIKIKKQKELEMIKSQLKEKQCGDLHYGMVEHNHLHFSIRTSVIKNFYAHRLAQAVQFGTPLVLDFGLWHHMKRQEQMKASVMLQYIYGTNIIHREPFDLHFCNLVESKGTSMSECLTKCLKFLDRPAGMITVSEKSYLELFPDKKRLIYLSPDAPKVMERFEEDAIYILGVLVDKGPKVPLTLAKAKKEGIRCLKLPLDNHLLFKSGASKNLPFNQVLQILLEVRYSGDWKKAFRHIPKRAVYSANELPARNNRFDDILKGRR